jgi:hypothetical protein
MIEQNYWLHEDFNVLEYCRGVLRDNIFLPCEVDYYQGKVGNKSPHGIPNIFWQIASKGVEIKTREVK